MANSNQLGKLEEFLLHPSDTQYHPQLFLAFWDEDLHGNYHIADVMRRNMQKKDIDKMLYNSPLRPQLIKILIAAGANLDYYKNDNNTSKEPLLERLCREFSFHVLYAEKITPQMCAQWARTVNMLISAGADGDLTPDFDAADLHACHFAAQIVKIVHLKHSLTKSVKRNLRGKSGPIDTAKIAAKIGTLMNKLEANVPGAKEAIKAALIGGNV
jgi:hypothetical protein